MWISRIGLVAGQTFYGFADIAVNSLTGATPSDLTIFSVSYNNVAGQAITVAVPEPSSMLFMGMCVFVSIVAYARQLGLVSGASQELVPIGFSILGSAAQHFNASLSSFEVIDGSKQSWTCV